MLYELTIHCLFLYCVRTLQITGTQVEWQQSSSVPAKKNSATKPPPLDTVPSQIGQINFDEMPALITASQSKTKINVPPSSPPPKDPERLSLETKRMLLRHHEHAQTLSELVECFREARDPAHPTVNTLYESLKSKSDKFKVCYVV